MKTKLEMAHEWYMKHSESPSFMGTEVEMAWQYADTMQAEADKREKEEAKNKRDEMRKLLNADNTFIEKEGQHFDDMEWQPDWSKAPDGFDYFVKQYDDLEYFLSIKPDLEVGCWVTEVDAHWSDTIQNCPAPWRDSLRKRP